VAGMTEQQPRELVLKHAVLRGQLIELQGRWRQLASQGHPGWAKRCDAYQTVINDLTEVLDGDQ
jgi:hypothetical protein